MKKKLLPTLLLLSVLYAFNVCSQTFAWVNKYGVSTNSMLFPEASTTDAAGNIYITGKFTNGTVALPGYTLTTTFSEEIFVMKTNAAGTVLWAAKPNFSKGGYGNSIGVDANGNVFITAFMNVTTGGQSLYAAKFGSSGNFIQGKTIGGTGTNNSYIYTGAVDRQNNFIVSGYFTGDDVFTSSSFTGEGGFIVKFDNTFNIIWSKIINGGSGSSVRIKSIATDKRNNIIVSGNANGSVDFNPAPTGTYSLSMNNDAFTLKLDDNGLFKWVNPIRITQAHNLYNINNQPYTITGSNNEVYVSGSFTATVDFDNGSGVSNLTAVGRDIFVLRLDSTGNFEWVKKIGGINSAGYVGLESIATDNNSNIFLTGNFQSTIDFNPSAQINSLSASSSSDAFIAKLNANGDYVLANNYVGSGSYCQAGTIAIDANGNVSSTGLFNGTYDFDPGSSVSNLTGFGMFMARFSGCAHNAPNLCLVTVDSLALNNVIYWDKSAYPSADTFIVYRYDAFTTNYLRIGAMSHNQPNFLTDTARTTGGPNGGNPQYSSYRYKLAIKDLCGTMGTKGLYHESIFIQQNNQNFSWNAYGIEGQSSPATGYQFMRDNNNTGSWQVLVNTGGLSTTDPNYSSYPNGNWRVDALGFACNPTAKMGPNAVVNRSKSNVKNNFTVTSASELELKANVLLSPNPVKTQLEVHFSNHQNIKTEFTITDVLGKVISKHESSEADKILIPLNDMASGVYFLKINQGKLNVTKKFVKE